MHGASPASTAHLFRPRLSKYLAPQLTKLQQDRKRQLEDGFKLDGQRDAGQVSFGGSMKLAGRICGIEGDGRLAGPRLCQ